MYSNRLIPLYPYQVTTLLLAAAKETGMTFDIDAELEPGEFIMEPPDTGHPDRHIEVEGIRLSSSTPFETICSFVSMVDIENSKVLGFLAEIPFVGRLVWIYVCNRTARRFARRIGLGNVVFWG